MNILILMIPMAILFSGLFIYAFFWATDAEQFSDLDTPPHRMLFDENFNEQQKRRKNETP